MKPNDSGERGVFVTGTRISDPVSWYSSLVAQLRELRAERRNPPAPLEITAERDPQALLKLAPDDSLISSLLSSIRGLYQDTFHPQKVETTASPVEVEDIWSKRSVRVPGVLSVVAHVGIVALAMFPFAAEPPTPKTVVPTVSFYRPPTELILNLPKKEITSGGGGGGGMKQPRPPSKGRLPRGADKQITPPAVESKNPAPVLIVEPTIVAPQLSQLPQVSLLQIGDPKGIPGPPSAGPGEGTGIGTGRGRGVGEGDGPGAGPGTGGGIGDGPFRIGGGVTEPTILYRVEPQYSEEARKARHEGVVVLQAIVKKDGTVQIERVVRPAGFGLEEKAIQALRQWKFKPAMRNGTPVDVVLNIEVNFNLR